MSEARWKLYRAEEEKLQDGRSILLLAMPDPHLNKTKLVITAEPKKELAVIALLPEIYGQVNTLGPVDLPKDAPGTPPHQDRDMVAIVGEVECDDLDISFALYSAEDLKETDHVKILRHEWLEDSLPDRVLQALIHLAAYGGSIADTVQEINQALANRIRA